MSHIGDSRVHVGTGLRWMKLDNAAKIYPAARRRRWNNMFRLSATMSEPVDRDVLQAALDATAKRFPSIAARLRNGAFWYYLEELQHAPAIEDERSSPLMHMPFENIRKCQKVSETDTKPLLLSRVCQYIKSYPRENVSDDIPVMTF